MVWFEKPDDPIFMTPDASLAISVFNQEDVEGESWTRSWLAYLILFPLANFWIFGPDHPWFSLFSYDNLFALGQLSLRWLNQDLLPIELDRVHVSREQIFVELHLGTLRKLQSSFIYGQLNPSTENIAIISSMRIVIMPFTICMLFYLFWRRYNMITWKFNLFFLQQVIKNPITFSDVESKANLILRLLEVSFKLEHTNGLDFDAQLHSATHVSA
jgi:hypothetical protein